MAGPLASKEASYFECVVQDADGVENEATGTRTPKQQCEAALKGLLRVEAPGVPAPPPEGEPTELVRHFSGTYFSLRNGMFWLAVALPIVLPALLPLGRSSDYPGSISRYHGTWLRDYFVGSLCAIGISLLVYKGLSRAENWALNIAGSAAFGVAFFPTENMPKLHLASALLVFGAMFYVAWFHAQDSFRLSGKELARRYIKWYKGIAILMAVLPIAAAVWHATLHEGTFLFGLEAGAIWAFALYWLTKSSELRELAKSQNILKALVRE